MLRFLFNLLALVACVNGFQCLQNTVSNQKCVTVNLDIDGRLEVSVSTPSRYIFFKACSSTQLSRAISLALNDVSLHIFHERAAFGAKLPSGSVLPVDLTGHRWYKGHIVSRERTSHVLLRRTAEDLFSGSVHSADGVIVFEIVWNQELSDEEMVSQKFQANHDLSCRLSTQSRRSPL